MFHVSGSTFQVLPAIRSPFSISSFIPFSLAYSLQPFPFIVHHSALSYRIPNRFIILDRFDCGNCNRRAASV